MSLSLPKSRQLTVGTVLATIGTTLLLALVYLVSLYTRSIDLEDRTASVIIEPGDSFGVVAERLAVQKVIPSKTVLVAAARLQGVDHHLTPGRYDFAGRNSCRSVLRRLSEGDFLRIRVTVPEGSPVWKVAAIVAEKLELDSATFAALNDDSSFLSEAGSPRLEGYLYPETYVFPWGVSEHEVARAMLDQFYAGTDSIWPDSLPQGLSRDEILTLASIIEAETKLDYERPLVASVYLNRLRRQMKLDADPTVIYGLGGLDRPLLRHDLRKDTPYNTYLHKGLPPTPINSPGLAALKAAVNPSESDYLYFVADETGGHVFSRTNAEHNRARERIKQAKGQRQP